MPISRWTKVFFVDVITSYFHISGEERLFFMFSCRTCKFDQGRLLSEMQVVVYSAEEIEAFSL